MVAPRILIAAYLCAFAVARGQTADVATNARPIAHSDPRSGPIQIDGRLDEPAWSAARPITEFIQQDPVEGQPATQRTEIRILFDNDALYLGARMFDSLGAKGVSAALTRRDELLAMGGVTCDRIGLEFDTFRNKNDYVLFELNPLGVKGDMQNGDVSYDPVWDGASAIDSLGWTAEFRIPFSQLHFSSDTAQSWGLQILAFAPARADGMSESIRVLIVDDESLAREGVRALVESEPDMRVVDACGDGRNALQVLSKENVDVMVLDIQMPGMDGFDVVRAIPEERLPIVIFLTAFNQHALRAFDADALDYVVKPFADARLRKALARGRAQVRQRRLGHASEQLASLVTSLGGTTTANGSARHTDAHEQAENHFLARIPVRSVGRLDPARFIRIHRSAIVSLEHVAEIRIDSADRQFVVMRDGARLPLGRSRRAALEEALAKR